MAMLNFLLDNCIFQIIAVSCDFFFFVPFRPKNFKIVKKKKILKDVKNLSYNVFGDTLIPQYANILRKHAQFNKLCNKL